MSFPRTHSTYWGEEHTQLFEKNRVMHNLKIERERLDKQYNAIKSLDEISGWTVLFLERHKTGVVKFHAQKGTEYMIGFARDALFAPLQLPP